MTNIDDCRVAARYPIIDAILNDQIKDPANELTDPDKQMVTNIVTSYNQLKIYDHLVDRNLSEAFLKLNILRVIPEVSGCDKLWEDIEKLLTELRNPDEDLILSRDVFLSDMDKLKKCSEEMYDDAACVDAPG